MYKRLNENLSPSSIVQDIVFQAEIAHIYIKLNGGWRADNFECMPTWNDKWFFFE